MGKGQPDLIQRDISWLSFNERVLQEATDNKVPLLERLKFLGIFSNNQDEFFRVRVATLRRLSQLGKKNHDLGEDIDKVLSRIQKIVIRQQELFEDTFQEIIRGLEKEGVHLRNEKELNIAQGAFVRNYFHEKIRPSLVPIMLDRNRKFPYLKDRMIYLLVSLIRSDKMHLHAVLEVPTNVVPRFVVLPPANGGTDIIMLDDIIRYCLDEIFSIFEYDQARAFTIKLTRDAELDIDNDINVSMIDKISKSLKKRKKGDPVRLVYDSEMSPELLKLLTRKLDVGKHDNIIPGGRYHNFKDFMNFPAIGPSYLRYEELVPVAHKVLQNKRSLFDTIRKQDILLSFPYQSYDHIIDLLREAAMDPAVQSISITLYRVARNSNIINALVNAARNGKSVVVIVELQARFDEENNIYWATNLQEEGVKVIFGVPGLKVHCKLFQIVREEGGKLVNYAHLGTGNFHEGTARVYSDFSLLTADKRITAEVARIFSFFSDNFKPGRYHHLVLSPFFMRRRIVQLINNEIKNAKAGKEAWFTLKLNSLTDEDIIKKIMDASEAGVKIRLIVRGVCSLVTSKGKAQNIEAISIIDRFLEHARVYHFCNGGKELLLLSSADMMARNLDHRVEVACPVYDPNIRKIIVKVLDMQFQGNVKVRVINRDQTNPYRERGGEPEFRAQYEIYNYFRDKLIN